MKYSALRPLAIGPIVSARRPLSLDSLAGCGFVLLTCMPSIQPGSRSRRACRNARCAVTRKLAVYSRPPRTVVGALTTSAALLSLLLDVCGRWPKTLNKAMIGIATTSASRARRAQSSPAAAGELQVPPFRQPERCRTHRNLREKGRAVSAFTHIRGDCPMEAPRNVPKSKGVWRRDVCIAGNRCTAYSWRGW